MSRSTRPPSVPRATIHKLILDVAASSPEKSMEGIATELSGATTELVERVLEEYGDPADSQRTHTDYGDRTMSQNSTQQEIATSMDEPRLATERGGTDRPAVRAAPCDLRLSERLPA